jgi:stearoyl-CoA desaturase (delta-9 desaturase)
MAWSMNVESVAGLESVDNTDTNRRVGRLAIETPYLHRMQLRHFVLFNLVPAIGTVTAIAYAFVRPPTALDIGLFFAMWLVTGLGVSAGYHRLFTHRAFRAVSGVRAALGIAGSMAGLGPVISWVAMHRRHHQCADHDGDMHSPNLHGTDLKGRVRGFLHAHLSWMIRHEYPNIAHYAPDLLEDRTTRRVSRNYQTWVLLGLLIPAVIGGVARRSFIGAFTGLLWGGIVRMFVVAQSISALNSVLHSMGTRRFKLPDRSGNSAILGALIWGEGWHHNHHAFPRSASFGLAWYYIDMSYWLIELLQRFGLAWDVIVPSRDQIASRSAVSNDRQEEIFS